MAHRPRNDAPEVNEAWNVALARSDPPNDAPEVNEAWNVALARSDPPNDAPGVNEAWTVALARAALRGPSRSPARLSVDCRPRPRPGRAG